MTEEQIKLALEAKARVANDLCESIDTLLVRFHDETYGTDERIGEYVREVAKHTDDHNVFEILAVARFFRLLGRYRWSRKRVRRFFKFYEALKFNGLKGRQRYRLTPVQCFQFASIFGFLDDNGRRLVRLAYLFVPRKFGKTTSVAALAVDDMLFGDNNAQSYVGANSYDQAKICFDEVRNIMRDIDPKERHFKVNREKINFKDRGRDSFARCLTANARTQDGLNASLVIMDEYSQARNTAGKNGADLKNVLTSSMGARLEPLTVVITTASEVIDGPFVHELEGVKKILWGEAENDRMFASLFCPDAGDAEDDPHTWAKVQPHLGITVQPDYYEQEYQNALLSAENMLTFRTKLLNIFTINETKTWFSWEKACELMAHFDIDKVKGRPDCCAAYDLSVKDDFSAVSYAWHIPQHRRVYIHTDYYLPEGAISGHPNEALYRTWADAGHLKLLPGESIDYRTIANDILTRAKIFNLRKVGYDRYKAQFLTNILKASPHGKSVVTPFSQTIGSFNLPVETFETLAYNDPAAIVMNNNPVNVWCLTNSVIMTDNLDNKKPFKASHNRKIDGAITALMALGLLNTLEH